MARAYAIIDKKTNAFLFTSAAFDAEDVREKVEMSEETELWISGEDERDESLQAELNASMELKKAQDDFFSSMSHDIRTPMNAIVGMTAIAKKHIDEKSRVMDSLDKIEAASTHLLSLINEVLDMSRMNSDQMILEEKPFSLSDLLHETLSLIRPQADKKGHELTLKTEDILYENLLGDSMRIRQIFVNILSNAVKYTDEKGKIEVSLREEKIDAEKVNLIFACQDNGIGMSEEFIERIFRPFERAMDTRISKVEGTGLGMSIVKQLVEKMDGKIEIESALGKGTLVTITLPLIYDTTVPSYENLRGRKVLILEKNEELKRRYRDYLSEAEVKAEFADSFTKAIEDLVDADVKEEHVDAFIIGKEYESTGNIYEIGSYLHQIDPELSVLLSNEDDWTSIEYRANRNHIRGFIPQPFFKKSLLRVLNEHLKKEDEEEKAFDLGNQRVLVVEDNLINRLIAKELLESIAAEVEVAENGLEGLNAYLAHEANYYHLILMDVQMPVMDGYEAVRKIREADKEDAKSIRILGMSANAFAEDVRKAKEAGMDGYLLKPLDIHKFMQEVSK